MKRRIYRTSITFLLVICMICGAALTARAAGPGENLAETESHDGASPVITVGASGEEAAAAEAETQSGTVPAETGKKGASLGMFTTTGYCPCSKCCGDNHLTYSGTVPRSRHTISADLNVLPIGTKVMIGDVIYTVEDMGSGVNDNWIDIFYDTHEEAEAHGMKTQEVFRVE